MKNIAIDHKTQTITVRFKNMEQIHFKDAVLEGMRDGHYIFSEMTNSTVLESGATASAWKSHIVKADKVIEILVGEDWDAASADLAATLEDALV